MANEGTVSAAATAAPRGAAPSARADVLGTAVIVICAVALIAPSLANGLSPGHDYPWHHNYVLAFGDAVLSGTLYPRVLGTLWGGAGGYDFFFYPPLVYVTTTLPRLLGCDGCSADTAITFAAIGWFSLIGLGTRALARRLSISAGAATLAGLVAMAAPYTFGVNWILRSAYAELMAAGLTPFLLIALLDCLRDAKAGPRLALLAALIALTHMVTAIMIAPVCAAIVLVNASALRRQTLVGLSSAAALALALAAIYWLPAVTLLPTVWQTWLANAHYHPSTYFNDPQEFYFNTGPFGLIVLLSAAMGLLPGLLIMATRQFRRAPGAPVIAVCLLVPAFMISPLGAPAFSTPPLENIQFPWRFVSVMSLGAALMAGYAADRVAAVWRSGGGVLAKLMPAACLLLAVVVAPSVTALTLRLGSTLTLSSNSQGFVDGRDGHPAWLPVETGSRNPLVLTADNSARSPRTAGPPVAAEPPTALQAANLLSDAPRSLRLVIELAEPAALTLKRTYWSGMVLTDQVTGAQLPIAVQPTGFPFAQVALPAGRHELHLEVPMTTPERVGMLASAVGFSMLVLWWAIGRGWLRGGIDNGRLRVTDGTRSTASLTK